MFTGASRHILKDRAGCLPCRRRTGPAQDCRRTECRISRSPDRPGDEPPHAGLRGAENRHHQHGYLRPTGDIRLDERQPVAIARRQPHADPRGADRAGAGRLVRNEPRRGIFVVKKTRKEIVGMIQAWTAWKAWRPVLPAPKLRMTISPASGGCSRVLRGQAPGAPRRILGSEYPLPPEDPLARPERGHPGPVQQIC